MNNRVLHIKKANKKIVIDNIHCIHSSDDKKEFICFEKNKNGTWTLRWTKNTIPNIKDLSDLHLEL